MFKSLEKKVFQEIQNKLQCNAKQQHKEKSKKNVPPRRTPAKVKQKL